jgi:hypothetical protein
MGRFLRALKSVPNRTVLGQPPGYPFLGERAETDARAFPFPRLCIVRDCLFSGWHRHGASDDSLDSVDRAEVKHELNYINQTNRRCLHRRLEGSHPSW